MNYSERESIILQILNKDKSVYYNNKEYIFKHPSTEIKYGAIQRYNKALTHHRFDDCWLSDEECLQVLISCGLCSKDTDINIKALDKEIENVKVAMYKNFLNFPLVKEYRLRLEKLTKKHMEMSCARTSLNHLTIEGFAEMIKNQYIMYFSLHNNKGERVWQEENEVDIFLLDGISNKLALDGATYKQIREISRTEPWRSYWSIKKAGVFGGEVFNLTEEQRSLILFSKMYDSAYSHPECPIDKIIQDDDMFDGWMINESRKRDKDRSEQQIKSKGSKLENSDEIFIMSNSLEEAKEINNLNDTQASIIKAQRESIIKARGSAVDANFQDRQVEIQQKANQQFLQKVRGK